MQGAADTPFFFQEFASAQPTAAADATAQIRTRHRRRAPQRTARRSRAAAAAGRSTAADLEDITQRVAAAAQAVLGRPVEGQQPLMEAGLDSLGEQ
jgi:hypothetical protein